MITQLVASLREEAYGYTFEADFTMGEIPEEELDRVVQVLRKRLEHAELLLAAREARAARTVDR